MKTTQSSLIRLSRGRRRGITICGSATFPPPNHCYREALKRSECRPAIYRRLFEIEYARGDREAARKSLKRMYELFPTNPRYRELVERHFPELLAPSR